MGSPFPATDELATGESGSSLHPYDIVTEGNVATSQGGLFIIRTGKRPEVTVTLDGMLHDPFDSPDVFRDSVSVPWVVPVVDDRLRPDLGQLPSGFRVEEFDNSRKSD